MKNKTHFTIFVLVITIFFTLGCQILSQAAPTPVSESTSAPEPASLPTDTPVPTEAPELDISSAVLTLDDLPAGFEEFSAEELGVSLDDFGDEALQPEEVFIFLNAQNFQMVFGFNFLLTSRLDRAAFDVGISQPEITLPALVSGMGSENVQGEKILEGFEDVGEARIGMTMIANLEGVPVQVDILMFRQDVVGAMVMSMVLEGQAPNITLHDLGLKLDQRIQQTLE